MKTAHFNSISPVIVMKGKFFFSVTSTDIR